LTRILFVPAPAIAGAIDEIMAALASGGLDVVLGVAGDLAGPDIASFDVIAGPGTLPCDSDLFARCPGLKGLVSIGSGCEGFDAAEAAARGINIATGGTPENISAMASATVMLMLALSHDLPGAQRAWAEGKRRDISRARLLDGGTIGLIGYGAIGRAVAKLLSAWDVTLLVASPSLQPGRLAGRVEAVSLDMLLDRSDIVSLHSALNASSRLLIDRRRLAMMKSGALLINTARGGLVDEAALAEALACGKIGGAALDCFEVEPLPENSPLRAAPNTIFTPHQIGHTAEGSRSIVRAFIENIRSVAAAPRRVGEI
jgi:phosphoglycerate dehydrogenase-like enzyme